MIYKQHHCMSSSSSRTLRPKRSLQDIPITTPTHTHTQEFHPQVIRLAAVVVEAAAAAGQYVLGGRCEREPFT